MKDLARSWLWFRRGLRRELRLPLAALALAAAAAGGIALFSARLEGTVVRAADSALGADLVVRAPAPLPDSLEQLAARLRLRHSESVGFPTVAVTGERLKLASARAVTAPYPLRGKLVLRRGAHEPAQPAAGIPPPGTVWASPGLAAALDQGVGGTLTLGGKTFRIGALIVRAPGAELDLASIAPLVVMNRADLAATGLAGAQSRIRYELLLAGAPALLARFRNAAKPLLPPGAQVRDINDVSPGLRDPLDSTRNFLRLAVLATLLIAAAALVQCARHYAAVERRSAAVLKTLGAGRARVRALYAAEAAWLVAIAGSAGALVGWGIALGLAVLGARWFHLVLVPAPLATLWIAPATAAVLATGLWLAPVMGLPAARPVAALRGAAPSGRIRFLEIAAGLAALAILLLWRGASELRITLWTLAATGALLLMLGGIAFALTRVVAAARPGIRPAWRYGAAQLARRRARSLAELTAFGLVITVVLLLTGVRHDLIASWRANLPRNAPDHFIINVQPAQREAVARFLAGRLGSQPTLYPMVRARLTAIDGVAASQWAKRLGNGRAHALLEREQTLSMRARPGPGNRIVAGYWWQPADDGKALVSADSDWARRLHVGIGDRLQFDVAGRSLVTRIVSLRDVHWQSFQPNFFLVMPPGSLAGYPTMWITAIHMGSDTEAPVELLRRFPNLTVVDVGAIIGAITDLLRHATVALSAVFGLAFAAAVLVLLAALQAGRAQRARELALLRVLGARRRQLAAALAAEFGLLGAVAGTAAGLVAAGAGYALAHGVFGLAAPFDGWLVLFGALAGTLGIGGIGLAATLSLTRLPPQRALRSASADTD